MTDWKGLSTTMKQLIERFIVFGLGAAFLLAVTVPASAGGSCGESWASTQHHHTGAPTVGDTCTGQDHPNGNAEYFFTYSGDDEVAAAGSASGYWDYVYLHEGFDNAQGQGGRDYLEGSSGGDGLNGGNHADEIHGAYDYDRVSGGRGGDIVIGGAHTDILRGGNGEDKLYDTEGRFVDHDEACGGGSFDTIDVDENASSTTDAVYNPFYRDAVYMDPEDNEINAYCNGEPTGSADLEDLDEFLLDLLDELLLS